MLLLWDQKYAPKSLLDGTFIWENPRTEKKIRLFTDRKLFSHLFLHGKPGVGKSTIADLLPYHIGGDTITNAVFTFRARTPLEASADYKRMVELPKTTKWTHSDRCYIIIHEIEQVGSEKLGFLRNTLDIWGTETDKRLPWMLIATSNTATIPIALKERMMRIEIKRPSTEQLVAHGQAILAKEGLELPEEVIRDCARYADNSPRVFLKQLCQEAWLMEMV